MTDIVVRDLSEEEYFSLLREKREGDYDNWREFFLEKIEVEV